MTARLALIVSVAALLFDAGSLVHRVRAHATDFSVFHRTASAVAAGAGAELYATRDPVTGWFRALPPAGLLLFLPLARLDAPRAAVVWVLANLALLAASIVLVRRLRDRLRDEHGDRRGREVGTCQPSMSAAASSGTRISWWPVRL